MKILLLEDEESIRGFIRINLKRNGMDAVEAATGEEALDLADNEGPFPIALLDVMLPTISGLEVCEQLRSRYPAMGIIMLTAKAQEEDKIRGLELGADDYIQKPFSPGELIARIKSLSRRMRTEALDPETAVAEPLLQRSAAAQPAERTGAHHADETASAVPESAEDLVSGPFRLAAAERRLWKNGAEIELTPTEWALVKLLMERSGESVSRDVILSEVWGRFYVGDLKVVDVNIRRIRQKLESNPSDPRYLETVWGFGYRWKRGEA
ncbi:response regulator transcription factor [Paenibacillus beijingensis]|uniref:Chemotaxis protein CheY n=1 Tax=Paenibacillus beijingensis TaxID=1126833 RepID=A0A0D5NGS7_9BACL|nr:response regulator transcription factor [Paenibacillus beijingensis]AJY74335.1 chemotaxis protein CheY [Paenibacillus beijingensis]